MPTITMLQPVGDWPAGATVRVDEKRADRLVRTGYAVRADEPSVSEPEPVTVKLRRRERTH